ncbi:hypothetical protein TIFTF001_016810 [Ficus carica]|uniref:Ubiquitin-like protease family profile domain-containing protein n=1 Tax=Ficus carica TaxID=3494 RepID=A0AA88DA58_FICCA|nr:hypothetical protein TIFTF001_016810 [Ficus carica]
MRDRADNLISFLRNAPKGRLYLVPHNRGRHWVLGVIDPWEDLVLYFDPLREKKREDFTELMNMALSDWKIMAGEWIRRRQDYKTKISNRPCPLQEGRSKSWKNPDQAAQEKGWWRLGCAGGADDGCWVGPGMGERGVVVRAGGGWLARGTETKAGSRKGVVGARWAGCKDPAMVGFGRLTSGYRGVEGDELTVGAMQWKINGIARSLDDGGSSTKKTNKTYDMWNPTAFNVCQITGLPSSPTSPNIPLPRMP